MKTDLLFYLKYHMGDNNFSADRAHALRYMQKWLSVEAIDRRGPIESY